MEQLSSKLSFGKVNRQFYGQKFRFMVARQLSRRTQFATIKDDVPPQMIVFNIVIPNLMHFSHFFLSKRFIVYQSHAMLAT